jgi:hypothetical protein
LVPELAVLAGGVLGDYPRHLVEARWRIRGFVCAGSSSLCADLGLRLGFVAQHGVRVLVTNRSKGPAR